MNATANREETLKEMEQAGASWAERAMAAIAVLNSKKQNPGEESAPSDPDADDQELDFNDEAITSDPQAIRSDPDPSQSDPPSDSDAMQPEPDLPPPPKFPFGLGNPLYEAALDFRAHRDKRSILDHLTDAQRDAIFELLKDHSEYDAVELLAKAAPAGLSIHVSRSMLQRFKKRYRRQACARNARALKLECDRLLETAAANDHAFLHASERLLKMRFFETTADPNANLEAIAKLTDILTRLRKQSLAERKHADSLAASMKQPSTPSPDKDGSNPP